MAEGETGSWEAKGLRLIAVDMDGTLLDADGMVPDAIWPILRTLRDRGITFAPASGRQYATLRQLFDRDTAGMTFIAENGAFVVRDEQEVSSTTLERSTVVAVLDAMTALSARGGDVGVVMCGKRKAFVARDDAPFLEEVRKYYASYEVVGNLHAVDEDVVKVAIFDFGDATASAAALSSISATNQVVVSGPHWVDVMTRGVNKGVALVALQQHLGIGPDQTAAFGDYLNDLEMLQAARHSFAMENAHPTIKRAARHMAPHHADDGVVTVLRAILQEATEAIEP